jgi:MFS transporter, SP family, general alpha glucoside:H+ symporter
MTADPKTAGHKSVDTVENTQSTERMDTVVDADLARDAQFAADAEKSMSLWQGMKAYPRAVGWSVVISIATTMDGYDTGFLAALLGLVSNSHV